MQRNPKTSAPSSPLRTPRTPDRLPAGVAARTIVLVGLMGVGKTTVGRRLARVLGRRFVDADSEIEFAADMTIADMFEHYGEAEFRDGERRVIARLLDSEPIVLATGGGAFVDPQTRALIAARAISVWLDADLTVLAERVTRRDTRPLLRGGDPLELLRSLADARRPIYARADIRVTSDVAPHGRTVSRIIEGLAAWNG
jgi:shikimate kinase